VIGSQSFVGPGVQIGNHCVVAVQSMVTHSVPDNTIVAGVPAKPIGRVVLEAEDVRFEFFQDDGKA